MDVDVRKDMVVYIIPHNIHQGEQTQESDHEYFLSRTHCVIAYVHLAIAHAETLKYSIITLHVQ